MAAVYAILLVLSAGVPAAVGCLGLAAALQLFLGGAAHDLGTAQLLSLGAVLLSIPAAALLAGVFFDSFVESDVRLSIFSQFLPVLACALMLSGSGWIDYLSAALDEGLKLSVTKQMALFVSSISAACFCAALSAFVMLMAAVLFELPVRWLQGAVQARLDLALAGARPLLIILGISISFNLLLGLFSHELWPTTIAARIFGA